MSAAVLIGMLWLANSCAQPSHDTPQRNTPQENTVILDSNLSFTDAVGSQPVPNNVREQLCLVELRYYSFDGKLHQGQLVVHKSLKDDVTSIFREIEENGFPIAKMIPISSYKYSDELSMLENNTSAFNYRTIEGTNKLSNHALGRAIDINPLLNPLVRNRVVKPRGATYDPGVPGTIVKDGFVVKAFKKRAWRWGGDWKNSKDYQHFEKAAS